MHIVRIKGLSVIRVRISCRFFTATEASISKVKSVVVILAEACITSFHSAIVADASHALTIIVAEVHRSDWSLSNTIVWVET